MECLKRTVSPPDHIGCVYSSNRLTSSREGRETMRSILAVSYSSKLGKCCCCCIKSNTSCEANSILLDDPCPLTNLTSTPFGRRLTEQSLDLNIEILPYNWDSGLSIWEYCFFYGFCLISMLKCTNKMCSSRSPRAQFVSSASWVCLQSTDVIVSHVSTKYIDLQ